MSETDDSKNFRVTSVICEKIITTDDDCNHLFFPIFDTDLEICAHCGSVRKVEGIQYYHSLN